MELILNALFGALANIGQDAVKEAYLTVKKLIRKKWGENSDLAEAMERLEMKPNSAGRRATLAEELAAAKADQDDSVVMAAKGLLEKIQALPGATLNIQQTVSGNHNIFSGSGDVSVNYDGKKK